MNFVVESKNLRGSAITTELRQLGEQYDVIASDTRRAFHGRSCETLFFCAGSHLDWRAREDPNFDFRTSVNYLSYHLHEIHWRNFVLISSTSVYDDPSSEESTRESLELHGHAPSTLSFHQRTAESFVRQFAPDHLIVRVPTLAGLDLDGQPTVDGITSEAPTEFWPESELNVLHADSMARYVIQLLRAGVRGTFNLAATDTICGSQVEKQLGRKLHFPTEAAGELVTPNISIEKASAYCQFETSGAAFAPFEQRKAG
ncbi:MAG: DNA-binding NarL/FixJ family response regulator [Planctomycetota bacterium]|jgi:DNA-binding NarL/FixJ family response regulator